MEKSYELDVLAAEVRCDGIAIRLSRGEMAMLLALALARRPCRRGELIEQLYPHLDESTATVQLKVYVHRVRRRLGRQDAIVFTQGSYELGSAIQVDFWSVENQIASALSSKGALPADVRERLDCVRARFVRRNMFWSTDRDWESALERRLSMLLLDVTVRLGEAALESADPALATRYALEVFDLDPCDERGAELAIRAHKILGNHDAALRQYRRYERELEVQLAVKPSDQLSALVGAR